MSTDDDRRYELTVLEHADDGSTKELTGGRSSAVVLAICAEVRGEPRVLTLHGGPDEPAAQGDPHSHGAHPGHDRTRALTLYVVSSVTFQDLLSST